MRVELFGYEVTVDETRIDADADEIRAQIREYAAGERTAFDLPVALPEGFTGDVMERMLATPYGETRTYGEVAADLDSAAVAVGQACGRNPLPVIVPCHRIVGADSIGGYSLDGGQCPTLKAELLALESRE